ncbi:MAG: oxygen-dependent coproporphyrinogen oxidase [Alphaproteobacteria bacterium]|nr:oxygen-dependent coproporphyrinogen oxidase [Alphaproteobacteria bacterium]MCB9974055.1 oxygen-dependent coproporphyrinogen oxidase [Rhodospirillales bacterium]
MSVKPDTNAIHDDISLEDKQEQAANWFYSLQALICEAFEKIEEDLAGGPKAGLPAGRFEKTPWEREKSEKPNVSGSVLQGGGTMAVMRGRVFEKVGVNVSRVHGIFSPDYAEKIPGADESKGHFWASGISLVAHMQSPLVPAVHMNTRMIMTSQSWFGGGADLTPMFEDTDDTQAFHDAFKECCDSHDPDYYPEFKAWCDRYFYLPHRNEPRGIGGIFYDYLDRKNWGEDFSFTKDVGRTFLDIYPKIVRRSMNREWTDEEREHQLVRRGRYVEFNLLYDRGTQFGLKTGGNTEAILMSMPPVVKWP